MLILYGVLRDRLTEKVTETPEGGKGVSHEATQGRAFQANGTANARALTGRFEEEPTVLGAEGVGGGKEWRG